MALFSDSKHNLTITEAVEVLQRDGLDVSSHKLRQYEKHGLVSPKKSASQYRLYSDKELNDIRQVLYFIVLGFSIKAIKQYFDLRHKASSFLLNFSNIEEEIKISSGKLHQNTIKANGKNCSKMRKKHAELVIRKNKDIINNKNVVMLSRYIDFSNRILEKMLRRKAVLDSMQKNIFHGFATKDFEWILKKLQKEVSRKVSI